MFKRSNLLILLLCFVSPAVAQRHLWKSVLDTAACTREQTKTALPAWVLDDFDLDTQAMANPAEKWNARGIKDSTLRLQRLNWLYHSEQNYIISISAGGFRNNTVYILASRKMESLIYIRNGTKSYSFRKFRRKFIHDSFKTL